MDEPNPHGHAKQSVPADEKPSSRHRRTRPVWTWFAFIMAAIGAIAAILWAFLGGKMTPEQQYVRQKIPVEIESGKPVTVEINLSGNGVNDVAIKCPPEVWNALMRPTKAIEVRLTSSDHPKTAIGGVDPTSGGTAFIGSLPNVHYLFYVYGEQNAKASMEITFPDAPPGTTRAEIIVGKTPADTCSPFQ
jgi:hypothetical protein